MPAERRSFKARWIFPVDSPPLENGTIEIEGGRIVAVHTADQPAAEDLGNAAIVPGLVNTHTHLEFSNLTEPLRPARPFADWIRSLIEHRRERTGPAVEQGIRECRLNGITTIGEIATDDIPESGYPKASPRIVSFRESLGLMPERIDEQLSIVRRNLSAGADDSAVIRGLSPHAPWSVHPDLFRGLIDLADEYRTPLAMHLAETKAELELLARGAGELVEMMKGFDAWSEDVLPLDLRPLDYLRMLEKLDRVLVVHGNYLTDEELDFIAEHPNQTVVYCPRTHHYFGHDEHPWRKLIDRNVNVALGTDSRASNPDLNLWKELHFLHRRYPDVSPATLLQLGTLNGAVALGLEAVTGSLTVGKAADLAVVTLQPFSGENDPYTLLFDEKNHVSRLLPEVP